LQSGGSYAKVFTVKKIEKTLNMKGLCHFYEKEEEENREKVLKSLFFYEKYVKKITYMMQEKNC